MITDKQLRLANAQDFTVTAAAENVIDLGTARDMGEGETLYAVFTITTACADLAGAATLAIVGDTALPIDGSSVVLATTKSLVQADMALGARFVLTLPVQIASLGYRYLGAYITLADACTVSMTIDIVKDIQDGMKWHASGFSVT